MFGRPISNRYKYYWYTVFTQLRFTRIINIIFVVQFLKFNLVQFGLLQSVFLLSQFASELPSGVLGDLFRKKAVIIWGLVLLTISPMVMISASLVGHNFMFTTLLGVFLLEGVGNALLSGADEALFFEAIRRDGLAKQYAKIRGEAQFIGAIVVGAATFLGGVLYAINRVLPYFFQSLMVAFAGLVIFSVREDKRITATIEKVKEPSQVKNILTVFAEIKASTNVLFLFIFTALMSAMVNAIFAMLPAYFSKLGFSSSANGLIFMLFSFVGGLVAAQAYRLTKVSSKTLALVVAGILGLGVILQMQASIYFFSAGVCLLYITVDILDPIVLEMLNLWVKDSARATLISGLSFATSLVTMLLNPLIGMLIQVYGTIPMLVMVSMFAIVMILFFVHFSLKSKPQESE